MCKLVSRPAHVDGKHVIEALVGTEEWHARRHRVEVHHGTRECTAQVFHACRGDGHVTKSTPFDHEDPADTAPAFCRIHLYATPALHAGAYDEKSGEDRGIRDLRRRYNGGMTLNTAKTRVYP